MNLVTTILVFCAGWIALSVVTSLMIGPLLDRLGRAGNAYSKQGDRENKL